MQDTKHKRKAINLLESNQEFFIAASPKTSDRNKIKESAMVTSVSLIQGRGGLSPVSLSNGALPPRFQKFGFDLDTSLLGWGVATVVPASIAEAGENFRPFF